MNRFLKYFLYILISLIILAIAAYFVWFRNPYEHKQVLNPEEVYTNSSNSVILTNARIIELQNGIILDSRSLFIKDGRIEKIFDGSAPDSLLAIYPRHDLENRFLMAGLHDMHTHLNSGGILPVEPEIRKSALEQFLRYGVTSIFTLGGHGFDEKITTELKDQGRKNQILSPTIYATGDIFTVKGGYPIPFLPMMMNQPLEEINLKEAGIITIDSDTDLASIIAEKNNKELDGIKLMVESGPGPKASNPRLSLAQIKKIVTEAKKYDLPVFAHVTKKQDMIDAVDAGVDAIVHIVGTPGLDGDKQLLQKIKEKGIVLMPTLSMAHRKRILANPDILEDDFLQAMVSPRTVRSLENWPIRTLANKQMGGHQESFINVREDNLKAIYAMGIPILMGTDAGNLTVIPGYSAHLEMEFMSKAGMSNLDILRSATILPSQFLKSDQENGSIEEGKVASLIILKENPLDDIKNTRSILRVMHKGFWIE